MLFGLFEYSLHIMLFGLFEYSLHIMLFGLFEYSLHIMLFGLFEYSLHIMLSGLFEYSLHDDTSIYMFVASREMWRTAGELHTWEADRDGARLRTAVTNSTTASVLFHHR